MLPWTCERSGYKDRLEVAGRSFLKIPNVARGEALEITAEEVLRDLSFACFVGWLYLGHFQSGVRIAFVPASAKRDRTVLCLAREKTTRVTPHRGYPEFLVDFFRCPLDELARGESLTVSQQRLCPVVNKLRYNLGQDGVAGTDVLEPQKTEDCCSSKKAALWDYLDQTLLAHPELYGALVGHTAIPLQVPFDLVSSFFRGMEHNTASFGELLEETLLWYGGAASKCPFGFVHASLAQPFRSCEIDVLLVDPGTNQEPVFAEPEEGWKAHAGGEHVALIELTIGHSQETAKISQNDGGERASGGKDAVRRKLTNLLALRSLGLASATCSFISVSGETAAADASIRAAGACDGFTIEVLSAGVEPTIAEQVLGHFEAPIAVDELRKWHSKLIGIVEGAGRDLRTRSGAEVDDTGHAVGAPIVE